MHITALDFVMLYIYVSSGTGMLTGFSIGMQKLNRSASRVIAHTFSGAASALLAGGAYIHFFGKDFSEEKAVDSIPILIAASIAGALLGETSLKIIIIKLIESKFGIKDIDFSSEFVPKEKFMQASADGARRERTSQRIFFFMIENRISRVILWKISGDGTAKIFIEITPARKIRFSSAINHQKIQADNFYEPAWLVFSDIDLHPDVKRFSDFSGSTRNIYNKYGIAAACRAVIHKNGFPEKDQFFCLEVHYESHMLNAENSICHTDSIGSLACELAVDLYGPHVTQFLFSS